MPHSIKSWITDHDDKWPFFVFHLTISIVLSVYLNLGFFFILILIHFLLDFLKHWHSHNRRTNDIMPAVWYAIRDGVLLDLFLVAVAFAFGYVFHHHAIAVTISNSARLLRFIEAESLLRALSRIVVADWILAHIAWLSLSIREMDKRKFFMPAKLTPTELLVIAGTLLIVAETLLLPFVMHVEWSTLGAYARSELIPGALFLQ